MAKKKAPKKTAPKQATKKTTPKGAEPKVVVFYELSGVAGVRFYGEFAEVERARAVARALVMSPDVTQAWVMQDLEIIRKPSA